MEDDFVDRLKVILILFSLSNRNWRLYNEMELFDKVTGFQRFHNLLELQNRYRQSRAVRAIA